MNNLQTVASRLCLENEDLPFSIYASSQDQHLLNVPIIQPLLICVLGGMKELGECKQQICSAGEFVFLSNTPQINMRNISQQSGYFALLIGFDYQDFEEFQQQPQGLTDPWFVGSVNRVLSNTLMQFLEWSAFAPRELWHLRRREILQLMYHLGYHQVASMAAPPSVTHQVERVLAADISGDVGLEVVASELALSESTLRRKLNAENTHFQAIKDRVRLGYGLHLLQTTHLSIGRVAEEIGYQSQSRFTDKFKGLFGLTPSQLRKTRTQ